MDIEVGMYLVSRILMRFMMEDIDVMEDKARQILNESVDIGNALHPEWKYH